ncbi:YceD family protein [Qipengyuania sp. MTN3-11]|uniref:YceD family protein n=1 Tax=Qipengyuania sp. MTN3-11 TaxID=3056557 RepID=UPI0036F3697E
MSEPGEFTRMVRSDALPARPLTVTANEAERLALARRFGLPAIHALEAQVSFSPDGEGVRAEGTLAASFDQLCAVSGDPFGNTLDEPLGLLFVPSPEKIFDPEEEIELADDELDEIAFEGREFDLGEAIAQSFALSIDPYAEGPDAAAARREAGLLDEAAAGPFAALAALKKDRD